MLEIKEVIKRVSARVPEIEIEKLLEESIQLTLKGDPFFQEKFEIGDRFLRCDYDLPEKTLSQIYLCSVGGPVTVSGEETLETSSKLYKPDGELEDESYCDYLIKEKEARKVLFISRDATGKGKIEDMDDTIPLLIKTGDRWETKEIYRSGKLLRECSHIEEIDGPYRVKIGDKEEKCLRWLCVSKPEEKKKDLAEVYISVGSGLGLLFKRYNGPGWYNLDTLKNSPKIEFGPDSYYLWYYSIPIRDFERNGLIRC